jgi:electron transfer flavoprotein alpha/beta subunit
MEVDKDCWTGRCRRELKGGYEILEAALPRVVSVKTACNEPRFMGYRLKPAAFEKDRASPRAQA